MGGEWARVGQLAGEAIEPAIGDVWVDKRYVEAPWPNGRANVTDVLPFVPKDSPPRPVERVCVMFTDGRHEWMSIADLRKRFVFRRKADV